MGKIIVPNDLRHDHQHPDLQRDLQMMERMRQRRQMLGWLASGGAAAFIAGCGGGGSA